MIKSGICRHTLYVLYTSLFILLAPQAHAKETITWLIWDLPPEFIKSGPWKNQGYADKFLNFFIENLPEYNHEMERVNIPRWSREVLKPNRCSAHLWGGFFPDKLLLSKPYSFTPPHVAIFHKRHASKIGPKGSVISLERLLKKPDLKLIIMRLNFSEDTTQSRYPVLQPYLQPYVGADNLVEESGSRNIINLKLLDYGRADYTIGYPSTVTTQRRVNGLDDNYVSYYLAEHNIYKNVYVACLNDTFGKKVITQIDQLLTEETYLKFLEFHEEWNNKDPVFRQMTIDYFIKGLRPENVIE